MFSQRCPRGSHSRRVSVRFWTRLVLLSILIVSATPALAGPDDQTPPPAPPPPPPAGAFAPGRVLVQWNGRANDLAAALLLSQNGWQVVRTIDEIDAAVVLVPAGTELAAVDTLLASPLVSSAEPDYVAYALGGVSAEGIQPNDRYWSEQWWTRRMDTPRAWELTTGAPSVLVAVIDSGIDLTHPEFAGRLEPGYDYVDLDGTPQDTYGHGTHTAGIIAARGSNNLGVAGMAWTTRILPLRVLDSSGFGRVSDVAAAVTQASTRGASVINLSLALSSPSTTLHNAIIAAYNHGALVVGATGNDSLPGQPLAPVRYPAAHPEVLAVASTTHWEDWASYSNGGAQVAVAAPGGEPADPILSASLGGGYAYLYGTSMAAAQVSGLAALVRAQAPLLSNNAVADVLRNTADKIGSYPYSGGRNDRLGYGRVNALAALRWTLTPQLSIAPAEPVLLTPASGPARAIDITLTNASARPLRWEVVAVSPSWLSATPAGGLSLTYAQPATLRIGLSTVPSPGRYNATVELRTTDPFGQATNTVLQVRVVVAQPLFGAFLPAVGRGQLPVQWFDTSAGLGMDLGDDGTQAAPLPFAFPFYGRDYDQVWINANGFLSFGSGFTGSEYALNHCVPAVSSPNGAIYALWDDLDPSQAGQVRYHQVSSSQFVVEWRDVPAKSNGHLNSFQVLLSPDGQVRVTYAAVADPSGSTVGVESWDASIGLQVACNGAGRTPQPGQTRLFNTALP